MDFVCGLNVGISQPGVNNCLIAQRMPGTKEVMASAGGGDVPSDEGWCGNKLVRQQGGFGRLRGDEGATTASAPAVDTAAPTV